MANYLWKKLTDSERQKIEKEAKDLILEFGDKIEKLPIKKEGLVERDSDTREETSVCEPDDEFRKLMFDNAPNIKGDCIVAEKGGWE